MSIEIILGKQGRAPRLDLTISTVGHARSYYSAWQRLMLSLSCSISGKLKILAYLHGNHMLTAVRAAYHDKQYEDNHRPLGILHSVTWEREAAPMSDWDGPEDLDQVKGLGNCFGVRDPCVADDYRQQSSPGKGGEQVEKEPGANIALCHM